MKKNEEIIKFIEKDIENNLEKYVNLNKEKVIEFLLNSTLEELFEDFKIKNKIHQISFNDLKSNKLERKNFNYDQDIVLTLSDFIDYDKDKDLKKII